MQGKKNKGKSTPQNRINISFGSADPVVLASDLYFEQSEPTRALFDVYEYLPFNHVGYLEHIIALINNSPTAQSIVNKMSTYTVGEGFYLKKERTMLGEKVAIQLNEAQKTKLYEILQRKNQDGENVWDVCKKIAYNRHALGNAFAKIDIIKVGGSNVVFLSHQEPNFVRPFREKDLRVRKYGVSLDWGLLPFDFLAGKTEYARNKILNEGQIAATVHDVYAYPYFRKDSDGDFSAMLHTKNYAPLMYAWGLNSWSSGKHWAELEYRIAKFNVSKLKNGFAPSGMLQIFGDATPEQQKEYRKKFIEKMTGTGNDFKIMMQFSDNPDMATKFIPFEQQIDGYFKEFAALCQEEIAASFQFPLALLKATPGQLGGNQQLRSEFELLYRTVVGDDQQAIINDIVKPYLDTVAENEGLSWLKDVELGFINIIPVSFAGDINVENFITVDEGRELIGYSELQRGQVTIGESKKMGSGLVARMRNMFKFKKRG